MKSLRISFHQFLILSAVLILMHENVTLATSYVGVFAQVDGPVGGISEPGPYGQYHGSSEGFVPFTVFRSGEDDFTNSPLTVFFYIGGSAIDSHFSEDTNACPPHFADYFLSNVSYAATNSIPQPGTREPSLGFVIIPAGETYVEIQLRSLLDYDCEPTETVVLTLVSNANYNLIPDGNGGYSNTAATNQIYDTETAFSFCEALSPNTRMYQGETCLLGVSRSCGCDYPSYLYRDREITNSFALIGAELGVDYTLDSGYTHSATNAGTNVAALNTKIQMSNNTFYVTLTALTNNLSGGTKTIRIVPWIFFEAGCTQYNAWPSVTIVPEGVPILYSEKLNPNASFQFSIRGETNSLCYVSASTNLINWTNIGTVTLTNSTNLFIDSQATNYRNRFYKVYYTP